MVVNMGMVLCNQIGKDILGFRFVGNMDEQKRAYQNMIKYGVLPIGLNGHLIQYNYGGIIDRPGYKKILDNMAQFGEVISVEKLSRDQVLKFIKENPDQRFYMASERVNKSVSAAILKKDEIVGLMYACSFGDSHISIPYGYISPDIKYELAVPALFVKVISLFGEHLEKPANVLLFPSYESGYQGIKAILGEPDEECLVNEYYTICESREKLERLRKDVEKYNSMRNIDISESTLLSGYFRYPESNWITSATASRIPFLDNLSVMPKTQLAQYTSFLKDRLNSWGFNVENEINRILKASMRRKKRIDFDLIEYFDHDECKKIYEDYRNGGSLEMPKLKHFDISELSFCLADSLGNPVFDVIPEYLKRELHNREFIIVCVLTPDNDFIGLSMMGCSEQYNDVVNLEFIYIVKEYQTKELLNELILRTMSAAHMQGMEYFYIRNIMNLEDESFIIPDESNREYMVGYPLGRLITEQKTLDISKVVSCDNRYSSLPYQADEIHESEGLIFFSDAYDTDFQMFVAYGQNLMGTLCAKRITENELAIFDYWISEKNRDSALMNKLFYALCMKASEMMGPDTRVLIRLENEDALNKITEILGKEESRLVYLEQIYTLENCSSELEEKRVQQEISNDVNVIPGFIEKLRISEEKRSPELTLAFKDLLLLNSIPGLFGKKILEIID